MLAQITNFLIALGPWGILLLGLIDSAGVPVAVGVDALIIFLSAKVPSMAPLYVAVATLGSTAGTLMLFFLARRGGRAYLERESPGGRGFRFRLWFNRYGLATVFIPALVPVPMPMKLFVICAGVFGNGVASLTAVVVVARILRYGGEAYLGVQLGEHSTQFLLEHKTDFILFALGLFVALYLLIRITGNWRARRAAPQIR